MDLRKKILLVLCLVAVPVCSNAALECFRYHKARQLRERGHELDHQGRAKEAIVCYEESLKLYPYFLDLHQELAELYQTEHDPANAERCLSEAIKNSPGDDLSEAVLYRERGNFYLRYGKLEQAESDLKYACSKDPADGLAEKLLAVCRKKHNSAPVGSKTNR
ncbi:MAG: hypothetical protein KF760_05495 [Candidatus Eremiobacteraeota bacterium]|nr:hypothetical protein [Candidatus Eremiobacteraeota bacterium]MCW5867726.1 hypothetical protein [Candidatus Eremiobacteraeota bacterium]